MRIRSLPRPALGPRSLYGIAVAWALLLVWVLSRKSITVDEVAHIPAGYSYLRTGEVVLNPMHPPLLKELAAVPLLLLHLRMPVGREEIRTLGRDPVYQREFGQRFLLENGVERVVFWARLPMVLTAAGLAILVGRWSAELWGRAGALLSLGLFVFDPTVTAHAPLVTTDVGFACFAVLFFRALRAYAAAPGARRLLWTATTLGLAMGAKFSGAILPLLAFVCLLADRPEAPWTWRERVVRAGLSTFALSGLAYGVLWALYVFPPDPLFYLRGLGTIGADLDPSYRYFLAGEFRAEGWKTYLLVAWLLKTPLPSLLLLAMAGAATLAGRRAPGREEWYLLAPALAFFVGYSLAGTNLGIRHLVPALPFLYVWAGRCGPWLLEGPRALRWVLAALVVWLVAEFAAISPDHLSYLNELAGGSRRGPEWLDDSNVDWGQGLIQLRHYLEQSDLGNFRLCYFGSFDPQAYGVRASGAVSLQELASGRPPGNLVLSAHCVARARALLRQQHGEGPGNWLAREAPAAIVGHAYYVYVEPDPVPSP